MSSRYTDIKTDEIIKSKALDTAAGKTHLIIQKGSKYEVRILNIFNLFQLHLIYSQMLVGRYSWVTQFSAVCIKEKHTSSSG